CYTDSMQEQIPVVTPTSQPETLGSVAAKNFVAGASRALGSILVYLIFLGIMYFIFTTFFWPRLEPYVTTYTQAMESLQTLQNLNQPTGAGSPQLDAQQLQNLLNTYQY